MKEIFSASKLSELLRTKKYLKFILLALGSVLSGSTLVAPKLWFIEWISLVPTGIVILFLIKEKSIRYGKIYRLGFFSFFCFYLTTFKWFTNLYPLEFIDEITTAEAVAVVLLGWWGLSLLQALFGGLCFVMIVFISRGALPERFPIMRVFITAGLWAVYEWTQTLGWFGVPWARLPIGQTELAIGIQTASLFGSYFITFLLVSVNMLIAYIIFERVYVRALLITAASILVFQYGAGAIMFSLKAEGTSETVRVAAVQGNIDSSVKWDTESELLIFERQRKYTEKAAADGAEIVIWAETALPYTVSEGNAIYRYISDVAKECEVTLLVGAFSKEDEELYNTVFCFLPNGEMTETQYHKRHLVPFGEYVPMRDVVTALVPPLAELVMSMEDVSAGEDTSIFELEGANIGSLICFDSIYEDLARQSVLDGAEFLAVSTNDSWFTDSEALYMHNAQAKLRAVENRRYIVRSANTGISTIITDKGEVTDMLSPYEEGYVIGDIEINSGRSLYTIIGNIIIWDLLASALLLIGFDTYLKLKKIKSGSAR